MSEHGEWAPSTEAEAAMRAALQLHDQEQYFRVLSGLELLLPVAPGSGGGPESVGWGTWTTDGRVHVLAFTSPEALAACLGAGAAHRAVAFGELAQTWPNLEWWLAVNPGLPIEGYLPAWFVAQVSRGDVRLPKRGEGTPRMSFAEATRARAVAQVPLRSAPAGAPGSVPAGLVPAGSVPGGSVPGSSDSAGSDSAGSGPDGPAGSGSTPAADQVSPAAAPDPTDDELETTASRYALLGRPITDAVGSTSDRPFSAWVKPARDEERPGEVDSGSAATGPVPPGGPIASGIAALAPDLTAEAPATWVGRAAPPRRGAPVNGATVTPPPAADPAATGSPAADPTANGTPTANTDPVAPTPAPPAAGAEVSVPVAGAEVSVPVAGAEFAPANRVEEELLDAAGDGNTDTFLSTLLLAKVLIPGPAVGQDPVEAIDRWHTEEIGGVLHVVVFTSAELMTAHVGAETPAAWLRFTQLIRAWPGEQLAFAVNPGTPVGAALPGAQIIALANWAAEVGLTDEPEPEPPTPEPAPRRRTPPSPADGPVLMQKTLAAPQLPFYLERGYDRISGFVHRASEVAHLHTPQDLYAALGLSYSGSPFSPDDTEVYVLRWTAYRPDMYRIPYGGQHEAAKQAMQGWVIERAPFRGNGFAPSEGRDVIAEFKVDTARLPHGAQMWRVRRDDGEKLIAVFDADRSAWQRVGDE